LTAQIEQLQHKCLLKTMSLKTSINQIRIWEIV